MIGISIIKREDNFFIDYCYAGFHGEMPIDSQYIKTEVRQYEKTDYIDDELPGTGEVIATIDYDVYKTKDLNQVKGLILDHLKDNVFNTQEYKDWCMNNHRLKKEDVTFYKDETTYKTEKNIEEKDALDEKVTDKKFISTPDGQLMEVKK